MSDWDFDDGVAEAEQWAWEDRQRDELAITQHQAART